MRLLLGILIIAIGCSRSAGQEFIPYFAGETGNYLLNNLKAFWQFSEESGSAFDSSGNGYTLSVSGSPTAGGSDGIVNGSRGFTDNDETDYLYLDDTDGAFSFTNAFTITAWTSFVAPTPDHTGDYAILSRGSFDGEDFSWALLKDYGTPNDAIHFIWSTNGIFNFDERLTFSFDGNAVEGGHYFIAVRYNPASTLRLSVTHFGETELSADQSVVPNDFVSLAAQLRVGDLEGSDIHDMSGYIDEVGIWDTDLTDCQLDWLFTARSGSFSYPYFNSLPCDAP